jgi:glycosyltransferase involved in cell wall biosynthesis
VNILHVNVSDNRYGADRATYRIHRSLVDHGAAHGLQSRMRVITQLLDDHTVVGGLPSGQNPISRRLQSRLVQLASRGFTTGNPTHHSLACIATGLAKELRQRHHQGLVDLVHLHWLGNSTLSIEEIGRLPTPLIWTLHDQWAFCGAEHYTSPPLLGDAESPDERFSDSYSSASRPFHETGPDLNRRTWLRKRRSWRKPIHIVCPSHWLADCVRRSTLMGHWPVSVIPYPINLNVWAPCNQVQCRVLLGLPTERPLVLFGAMGGSADPRKGADLLFDALKCLHSQVVDTPLEQLELVVFGQSRPVQPPDLAFPIHYTGPLHDDISLRLLYAAADVFVIPSRQDNLPNTGIESHACGTPVVAFATGGLVDIVDHHITGALAQPYDSLSLAAAIRWVLEDPLRRHQLGVSARQRAERIWDPNRVARLYGEAYSQVSS